MLSRFRLRPRSQPVLQRREAGIIRVTLIQLFPSSTGRLQIVSAFQVDDDDVVHRRLVSGIGFERLIVLRERVRRSSEVEVGGSKVCAGAKVVRIERERPQVPRRRLLEHVLVKEKVGELAWWVGVRGISRRLFLKVLHLGCGLKAGMAGRKRLAGRAGPSGAAPLGQRAARGRGGFTWAGNSRRRRQLLLPAPVALGIVNVSGEKSYRQKNHRRDDRLLLHRPGRVISPQKSSLSDTPRSVKEWA